MSLPYGYRPYGYRPGWSFNMYFGRPYRLPIYGNTGYGYYAIDAGFAYGSLQIVDAPPTPRYSWTATTPARWTSSTASSSS